MSEQPIVSAARPLTSEEVEGWRQLAQESAGWSEYHAGLQQFKEGHLHRVLGEKGLSHLLEQAEDRYETEEIQAAMQDANDVYLSDMMEQPTFLERCIDAGVSPTDYRDNPRYWDIFADFSDEYVEKQRTNGLNEVTLQSIALFTKVPQFLFTQSRLAAVHDDRWQYIYRKNKKTGEVYDPRHDDVEAASRFNSHLRAYFDKFPAASVSGLQQEIGFIIQHMHHGDYHRSKDQRLLNDTIRGAMHESGFLQVLEYSSAIHDVRTATTEEDLRGIDVVVEPGRPEELCINVKASEYLMRKANTDKPYVIKMGRKQGYKDIVLMYSMLTDEQFEDRFTLPQEVVIERAGVIPRTIDKARRELYELRKSQRSQPQWHRRRA